MRSSLTATLFALETSVDLTLVADPEGTRRAMARAHGYAISHLATELPEPIRRRVAEVVRALDTLGYAIVPEEEALPRIARALRAAIPGARLVVKRRFFADQRAPAWPASMRSGAPREDGGSVWPFDAELAGLLLGRRTLLLREGMTAARADADAAWLASHGVATRIVDAQESLDSKAIGASHERVDSKRIYGAVDPRVLEVAAERHADACREHEGWADAARWMGRALGYPACCVESFVRARKRDDATMFLEGIPPLGHAPASPLTVWLDGALALVSHAPCSLGCAASIDLARAVLDAIEGRSPGFSMRWRALAARVHALTEDGRAFAIDAEGDLAREGTLRVRDAIELSPPKEGDRPDVVPARELPAGAELRVDRGWLIAPGTGWTATFVADHRGALE